MYFFETLPGAFNWVPFLDAAAKATVLLAAAGILTALLRKGSAASRHLIWTCALAAALALPVLSIALPRWQMPLVTIQDSANASTSPFVEPLSEAPSTQPAPGTQAAPSTQAAPRTQAAPSTHFAPGSPTTPSTSLANVPWSAVLGITWLAGTLLILGRLAIGILAIQWLGRRTEKVTDAAWLPLAREMAAQLGLSRVTFRRSQQPAMPMAWGVFRPSVLMPADADSWPQDRLRVVLLHELAHVRRADCLTHMLAQAACALYWMNPLAWIAARRLRTERERACDDLVLASGTPGPDYADQLLEIARALGSNRFSGAMAAASLAMARPSQLEGRLMSILDPSVPRTGVSRLRTAVVSAAALLALVPLASLQTWAYAETAMVPKVPVTQPRGESAAGPVSQAEPVKQPVSQAVVQGVAQGVVDGLAASVPAAIQGAIDGLAQNPNPNPNPNTNPTFRGEKSKADPKVVAALTDALKDSDKEVRESAMQALVHLRDPGIFDPLVQALKDASPDVRENAAFGLGQLRDKRASAPLAGALKDAAPGVRERAAFALGQLRDPAAVDGLATALRDENADVREQAAFALGQIRDERAVQPLVSVLKDPAQNVREQAVFALGQLRARSAVDPLIVALKDAEAEIREQAAFALGQIRDPKAIDALTAALKDASADVRQQAAFALGQLAR